MPTPFLTVATAGPTVFDAAVGHAQVMVEMKRIYDPPDPADGERVLVERLWPRGVSRERARLDAWEKRVAPSDGLRRWYGHDPARWDEFQRRYEAELDERAAREALDELAGRARRGQLTLLYSSRAGDISNAAVLVRLLRAREGDPA